MVFFHAVLLTSTTRVSTWEEENEQLLAQDYPSTQAAKKARDLINCLVNDATPVLPNVDVASENKDKDIDGWFGLLGGDKKLPQQQQDSDVPELAVFTVRKNLMQFLLLVLVVDVFVVAHVVLV